MAGNIYGYQGVHTPLESVTQGRYTLSDYTSMRTELTSRLIALENQGGFVPTNVDIVGYLNMVPGSGGNGEITTTSSVSSQTLIVNGAATCGSLLCNGTLSAGATTLGGNLNVNAGFVISGNGSGLTNIDDQTKLPLAGGLMTGNITMNSSNYQNRQIQSSIYNFSEASSAISPPVETARMYGNGAGVLLQTYSGSGAFTGSCNNVTPVQMFNFSTSANSLNAPLTVTGDITAGNGGKFHGDGSLLTGVVSTDSTKLPLVGGSLSGALNIADESAASNTSSLDVSRTSGGAISFLPAAVSGGAYNNIVSTGDAVIYTYQGQPFTLTVGAISGGSNVTSGLKLTQSSALLGAGGATGTPTSSVQCSTTTVAVTGLLNALGAITAAGDITCTSPGKFLGDGASLSGVLPIAGGTVTGVLAVSSTLNANSTLNVGSISSFSDYISLNGSTAAARSIYNTNYYYRDPTNNVDQGRFYANENGVLYTDISSTNALAASTVVIDGVNKFTVGKTAASFQVPTTINNDLTVAVGYKYNGDGSALTGVTGTDDTKLPKAGGTITGNLQVDGTTSLGNTLSMTSATAGNRKISTTYYEYKDVNGTVRGQTYANSAGNLVTELNAGCGSVTSIGGANKIAVGSTSAGVNVPLTVQTPYLDNNPALIVKDTNSKGVSIVTATTGVGTVNNITLVGDAVIYSPESQPLVLTPTSTTTSGVRLTNISAMIGAGGGASTPTAAVTCSASTVAITGTLSGNGSGLYGITATDNTKLATAGGIMTGDITFSTAGTGAAINYKRDQYTEIQGPGTFTIADSGYSCHDFIRIIGTAACTINLQNLGAYTSAHQDKMRRVTITKASMFTGDYVVTVNPPQNYKFYSATQFQATSTTIPLGTFSITYLINNNSEPTVTIESKV